MAVISPLTYGPEVPAFLDMISWSEGTSTILQSDNGYNVLVGGGLFHDYSRHPLETPIKLSATLASTAAGRYQLLHRYYLSYSALLMLADFSPMSQDRIAIQQIKERKALVELQQGAYGRAIELCSNIWASLPGNTYGQRVNPTEELEQRYLSALSGYMRRIHGADLPDPQLSSV